MSQLDSTDMVLVWGWNWLSGREYALHTESSMLVRAALVKGFQEAGTEKGISLPERLGSCQPSGKTILN